MASSSQERKWKKNSPPPPPLPPRPPPLPLVIRHRDPHSHPPPPLPPSSPCPPPLPLPLLHIHPCPHLPNPCPSFLPPHSPPPPPVSSPIPPPLPSRSAPPLPPSPHPPFLQGRVAQSKGSSAPRARGLQRSTASKGPGVQSRGQWLRGFGGSRGTWHPRAQGSSFRGSGVPGARGLHNAQHDLYCFFRRVGRSDPRGSPGPTRALPATQTEGVGDTFRREVTQTYSHCADRRPTSQGGLASASPRARRDTRLARGTDRRGWRRISPRCASNLFCLCRVRDARPNARADGGCRAARCRAASGAERIGWGRLLPRCVSNPFCPCRWHGAYLHVQTLALASPRMFCLPPLRRHLQCHALKGQ